jgi:tetratricopeptide (TPR) repeat protein
MKQRRPDSKPKRPRARWRWHVPPAILHGQEALEGTELLDEVEGHLGLALWQSLRDVTLWASFDPLDQQVSRDPKEREKQEEKRRTERDRDRAGLFAPTAAERRSELLRAICPESEVRAPLATFAAMLEDPVGSTSDAVARACHEISQWADEGGLPATALAFAQAASLASPANAAAGFRVGQLARKKGETARAETWFRRTIGLARQAKDWVSYSEAFLALGDLYLRRGKRPTAEHLYVRGRRAAKRHSLHALEQRAVTALSGGQEPMEDSASREE